MKKIFFLVLPFLLLGTSITIATPLVSDKTEECLACHAEVTPGIVADWKHSLHSRVTP
ncbi:MAG: hydroxylamine oxidase, partial [Deltaproteobacteria bacterium]|nr:hydroxylamine oxidase [Deltaproteobacteria bacterium]